ncbi:substrate-binding domain-containing protein [Telmatospirillum sp. J64-1]|uniref:substrate-binding domain-containing protein n=1 Tax=Telmatospirillum sp. J64-1 TaxID=2502183 RepID=UPI00115D95A3|nr:substrate-binding domain-containing protein [Telmatospirillum sp. J64-1]
MKKTLGSLAAAFVLTLGLAAPAAAQEQFIVVASTTSTEQSGLFKHILPRFTEQSGIEVRVVAQGTGQALKTAANGDADVVLVHDTVAEEKFVADGFGVDRRPVMYNDFILIGPKADPAEARSQGEGSTVPALQKIAQAEAPFVSRGDNSGTHAAELRFWSQAGVDVKAASGNWYRETGSGMGPTLNTAAAMDAYVLADRGTWLSFKNRGNLEILVEGDPAMFNQYGVILVNPERHPHVKADAGRAFMDWLTSEDGQQAIASYQIDGEQLFFPNAE